MTSSALSVVRSKPILLTTHEFGVDDAAMTRHVDGVAPADRQQAVKRVRPRRHIRIGVDRRITGFLDEITTEDHEPLALIARHHHDEISVSVGVPEVSDRHPAIAQVDDGVEDRVFGWPKGGDRAIDLLGVGVVT